MVVRTAAAMGTRRRSTLMLRRTHMPFRFIRTAPAISRPMFNHRTDTPVVSASALAKATAADTEVITAATVDITAAILVAGMAGCIMEAATMVVDIMAVIIRWQGGRI